jgi:phosphoribosyl 1,2-cyclic phosphodiesterase
MKLRFLSLASGSSGNCYFLGNSQYGILIDAGIGIRTIKKSLKEKDIPFENIIALFVTHDHADHIKAVGPLGEKHLIPIYSTRLVHEGIQKSYCVTEKLYSSRKFIEKGQSVQVGDFKITAFPVSHDSTDSVGYTVEYKEKRFTFATDLGYVGDEVASHLVQADYMVLEANYDEQMLDQGHYPVYLKNRIIAQTGHLSNEQAGRFLAANYNERTQHIFLCHLSKENNLPEVAYTTIQNHLESKQVIVGEHVQLVTLDRLTPSELYIF